MANDLRVTKTKAFVPFKERFGVASFLLGGLALALALLAFHIERFQTFDPHGQAFVLAFFDGLGLVKAPDMQHVMTIAPVYFTPINDANAVILLRLYAWWFSLWAIGIALYAESLQESTQFLSVGCVSGCFAVLLLGGAAGMAALVGCSIAISLLRFRPKPDLSA